jgi:hypothetical protein
MSQIVGDLADARTRIQRLQSELLQHRRNLASISEHSPHKVSTDKRSLTTCPNCGYEYDVEIYASIREIYNVENADYLLQQIRFIITALEKSLDLEQEHYVALMKQLRQEEQSISRAHDEYDTYIKQRGLMDTISRMNEAIGDAVSNQNVLKAENRQLGKELKALPNKNEVDERYIADTRSNIIRLEAWDNDYEEKIGLLKPLKGQGTLASKIILAQYIALFSTMDSTGTSRIRFPFVVDSPRTKEPSVASSIEILNMISGISSLPQIILVTMDYNSFDIALKHTAHIIELTEPRKLLNSADYIAYESKIKGLEDLIANLNPGSHVN